MSELTAQAIRLQADEAVAAAFNKLRGADAEERQEGCKYIGDQLGAAAEAQLRQRLAEHDGEIARRAEAITRRLNAPKVVPEPQAEQAAPEATKPLPEPLVRFASEAPATAQAAAPTLTYSSPYDTAREYVRRHCYRDGVLAMYFWQDQFWEWNERFYAALPTELVRDRLYAFLDGSKRWLAGNDLAQFKPTPKHVNDALDALRSGLVLAPARQPPMWVDTGDAATDVLVFRNGLVNVLTGELSPLTPKLWVHSAVDYGWDPQAQCEAWQRFLNEVFPGDQASQDCVEEQLGYGMTEDTKFEKAALWIGPKRSGKGTIAFVQRKLVGDGAYAGLSFGTWCTNENSKECLIGRRVGVFPDVRFKPGKAYGASYDPGGITHTSAELLLAITGQDHITIGRKYKQPWHGQLRLKLILISNEVPNLNDAQGILPSRFIKINFTQSFFGKEDVDLRSKLEAELPGIAARCIAAYRRLVARGKFIQPQSGIELERKVLAESDPFTAFVNELFVIDPLGMVGCEVTKVKFRDWCGERGRFDLLRSAPTASLFTQRLKSVVGLEQLHTFRPHGGQRRYVGLRLKTADEKWGAE